MWPACGPHPGMRREDRTYDLEVAKHGRCKDVEPRTVGEKKLRDVAAAHVSGSAEPGFPVAAAPVPCRVRKSGLLGKGAANGLEVAVGVPDEVLDERGIESSWDAISLHV